ncbi:DUF397 domain-containing protein [Actinomadura sp. 6N118]|uniref:DUF397 domain-containing protein n=1 Tax=Actinomadura sp. 6N118 TaxID=3375151 RepID=UPI0037B455E8
MTNWRKSSYSGMANDSDCVELAALWTKSSHSGSANDTSCVELAGLPSRVVGLRDSKDPEGPKLYLDQAEFGVLLGRLKSLRGGGAG